MNALLEQFLSESRDFLQGIGEKLMQLEDAPGDKDLVNELFRLVHTLKGNSGLFEFPSMTRVLHAGEDLMDEVRNGRLAFSRQIADQLLASMDFVGLMCDEIEASGGRLAPGSGRSVHMAEGLRLLIHGGMEPSAALPEADAAPVASRVPFPDGGLAGLGEIPESVRLAACRSGSGAGLFLVRYRPSEACFYQGEDPLHQARQTPGYLWGWLDAREPWPALESLDAYRCALDFNVLAAASLEDLEDHYRYVLEQVRIEPVPPHSLALPQGEPGGGAVPSAGDVLDPALALTIHVTVAIQRTILALEDGSAWQTGRIRAAAATLARCLEALDRREALPGLEAALAEAVKGGQGAVIIRWLDGLLAPDEPSRPVPVPLDEGDVKFGRRAEDVQAGSKSLKVDQAKVDRLMDLIGEMVVSKNALPYLAGRAETVFGVRELSREIKAQYAIINRIAEEMQDAIMQVRMMPVSFVFQRFPRLVRDTSRRLGKDVQLVLAGEETQADKNIIEALGDPLVHIVRNSLDHGFELPEVRRAAGKPAQGTLSIRATQESDRVVIEVEDDGKGIDPVVIKRKAYEKGVIDEAALERMSDQEAINLIFAPGLSTMEVVSDLSGRGVGMDVVRSAVEKVNGSLRLDSEPGKGTRITLSLPLSMAVTKVMIVESDGQSFGVPMQNVLETVRVPRDRIMGIKNTRAIVLRGRIVALKALNEKLGLQAAPAPNTDGELAVLVVRAGHESVGLLVDQFHEAVDVILKPMTGVLGGMPAYAGSALMGDGSVLMILNVMEMV